MSQAEQAPIRFGVLQAGEALESWQASCLKHLQTIPEAHHVMTSGAPEIDELRRHELDFILCFIDGDLPDELIDLPRHGVWRYHFGDWLEYRSRAAGFWEVYDHCAQSVALLVRVHRDPDAVTVLREGCLRTRLLSVARNREQLQRRFTHWPAEVCAEIRRKGVPGTASELRSRAAVRGRPTLGQRAVLRARIALRVAAAGLRSLFRHDEWNIGIIDQPVERCLTNSEPPRIGWLPATRRGEYRADPFGIVHQGRATILCEHFSYRDNVGFIVAIDLAQGPPGTRVRIGPEPAVHLSYPLLMETGGRLRCMPESSAAKEVALYDLERFPDRWTKTSTLLSGREIVDATVFRHGAHWWLSASEAADKGANSELHLWFAESVEGPWKPHPGNPVKIDVRSSRPAGMPFWVDGALYRPAQDCSSTYGARVQINRIVELTPTEFREEVVARVEPDPRGPYPRGLHTLSSFGGQTLVDGKRSVFVAAEFFRVLRHYLQ